MQPNLPFNTVVVVAQGLLRHWMQSANGRQLAWLIEANPVHRPWANAYVNRINESCTNQVPNVCPGHHCPAMCGCIILLLLAAAQEQLLLKITQVTQVTQEQHLQTTPCCTAQR